MRKIIFITSITIIVFASLSLRPIDTLDSPSTCKYYAYILYGEASLTSDIKKKEKVYFESDIIKSKEGYRVCCNDYCSDKCAGFSVKNIGPYESESICYQEMQKQLTRIENNGYKPYEKYKHMLIAVLHFNYKKCD
ncbi:MAG: hypothetical protein U1C70_00210 [Sediminibacterium sp.]|uniref:hypothetical protein n=1 Tax=Sediminibacterium sp. TaxID=1917865 RepID=UPI002AB949E7|nr:hypothetical protein [Sediminibacterium sp.]MDZ4070217.1 hypothetical protein [Sediminibacterium sp.]